MRRSRRGRPLQTPANDRPRLRPVHFLLRPSRAPAMKPLLIVGLGNPLMGDDGVGALLAESLAQSLAGHPRAEVLIGGTDLLRCAGEIEGRERVILIDAVQSGAEREGAGEITVTDEDPPEGLSVGTHSLSLRPCRRAPLAPLDARGPLHLDAGGRPLRARRRRPVAGAGRRPAAPAGMSDWGGGWRLVGGGKIE